MKFLLNINRFSFLPKKLLFLPRLNFLHSSEQVVFHNNVVFIQASQVLSKIDKVGTERNSWVQLIWILRFSDDTCYVSILLKKQNL